MVSCAASGDDQMVTVAFKGIHGIKKLLQSYRAPWKRSPNVQTLPSFPASEQQSRDGRGKVFIPSPSMGEG